MDRHGIASRGLQQAHVGRREVLLQRAPQRADLRGRRLGPDDDARPPSSPAAVRRRGRLAPSDLPRRVDRTPLRPSVPPGAEGRKDDAEDGGRRHSGERFELRRRTSGVQSQTEEREVEARRNDDDCDVVVVRVSGGRVRGRSIGEGPGRRHAGLRSARHGMRHRESRRADTDEDPPPRHTEGLQGEQQQRSCRSGRGEEEEGYYVVSSRRVEHGCATSFPLLGQLSKLGIVPSPVSLVWVSACIEKNHRYEPEEYPKLFQPQTWPVRLWNHNGPPVPPKKKGGVEGRALLFSVSGFLDSSRYGIVTALREMGGPEYTENLSRRNTHLICKEARGAKYEKAVEWGLHVVSIEWLYHVMRHGYEDGSEGRFSLTAEEDVGEAERQRLRKCDISSLEQPSLENDNQAEGDEEAGGGESGTFPERVERNRAEDSSSNVSASFRRRGKRDPSQASPKDCDRDRPHFPVGESEATDRHHPQTSPQPSSSTIKESNEPTTKRLHFALQALERPPTAGRVTSNGNARRRGKRERSPLRSSQESGATSLPQKSSSGDDDEEDENDDTQIETQFTTGTLLANAVVGNGRSGKWGRCGGGHSLDDGNSSDVDDDDEVPLSQANDAEDNGESQVVWFAPPR